VDTSYYTLARAFKSPPFVSIAALLKSRFRIKAKARLAIDRCRELERENQQLLLRNRQLGERLIESRQHAALLQQQRDEALASVNLPHDPPVGTHGYGPIMIALAVNLAMSIGFRAASRAIRIFYDAYGLRKEITPGHDSIRNWSGRLGIAAMEQGRERILSAAKRVIMVDHSCQIGDEKLMVVLGMDADNLPEPGHALRREDMDVLEVKAASQWKTEDMLREYRSIGARLGPIRQILIDGASELQNGAKSYAESVDHDVVIQRDAAHYAATQVKSILGKDEKFQQVTSQMGTTRSQVQQTELAFLSPPTPKSKARFMNLGSVIQWMTMMLWLLRNPAAECLAGVDASRFREKFGWIEGYADQIPMWSSCQDVISTFVTFANEQYLHHGASAKLATLIGDLEHRQARELRDRLVKFVLESESALQPGERLPLSTQLLESLFGQYKQLEGQQSKSGFTGLVSCIPLLHRRPMPASIRESFAQVTKKQVSDWVTTHVGRTLTSQRRSAYAEHRKAAMAQQPNWA
jgi:hypothetical protein